MIPKIIHYIWFGGNQYSNKIQKCINSWHKYLPDYEFMLWNENTFDIENSCNFVKEAFEHKKWAFVSDYVRIWALEKFGGFYLDTDVEVVRPLDEFINNRMVLGTDENGRLTAFMASEKNHPLWKQLLTKYHTMNFVNPDGSLNTTVNNIYIENILKKFGYSIENKLQNLNSGIIIYPDDWFHAANHMTGILHITENTYTIHWHTLTWCDTSTHVNRFIRVRILGKILGRKQANWLFMKLHNLLKK